MHSVKTQIKFYHLNLYEDKSQLLFLEGKKSSWLLLVKQSKHHKKKLNYAVFSNEG